MSKKVKIPTSQNPFEVFINGRKYVYASGTEQEVPDEVAIIIDAYNKKSEPPKFEHDPPFDEKDVLYTKQDLTEEQKAQARQNIGLDGTGVESYTDLTNKPSINGVELSGNKTSADLGIGNPTDQQVSSAVNTWLDEHPEATTTVADDSVTPNKTTFFKKATTYGNLYDKDNAETGALNCNTGAMSTSGANVNAFTCPAFPVTPGKSYFVGRANGTMGQDLVNNNSWAFYDADMNFVAQPTQSANGGWNPIPDGVAYMRVSVLYTTARNTCMVVEGTVAPTVYVSYADSMTTEMGWKDEELRKAILEDATAYMGKNLPLDGARINTKSIPITAHDSVTEYNLNLVNPAEVETKKSLTTTGAVADSEYNDTTGFIPVTAGRKYYPSNAANNVSFYSTDKVFVQKIAWSSAQTANLFAGFEVPADGFVRITFGTGNVFGLSDYGMNWIPAEYGTKKLVYSDENGTVFPQAVNDSGVVSAFEWKKVNLFDENKQIEGNATNGVFSFIGKWGGIGGPIIDVTEGKEYVFKGLNSNDIKILQYAEDWSFVSEVTVSVENTTAYQLYRYAAGVGVAHVIVDDCQGFFAESSDVAIAAINHLYPKPGTSTSNIAENLKVKYLPVGISDAVSHAVVDFLLTGQSDLLRKIIHNSRGLKWNCLGDSLTTLGWGVNMYNMVSEKLGLTPRDYGIVSSTIANYNNDGTTGNPMCVRYANMDDDADIVTVMGGTNDFAREEKVGTMADRDGTTLYGGCHMLFRGLIEKYPNARIGVILPPQNGQGIPSYVETQGGDPDMGYMRKKVQVIREVAEYYSLPVCDLFNHGGIAGMLPSTINRLLSGDYLHLTAEGWNVLSRPLLAFIEDLIG